MIVPDLSKTKEVNLVELRFRSTLAEAEHTIAYLGREPLAEGETEKVRKESIRIATDARDAAKAALDAFEPSDDDPVVTIRYIPPRVMTSIRHAYRLAMRDLEDVAHATREQLDALDEAQREIVRWGVAGHVNLGFEHEGESVKAGPLTYDATTWETVEVYEGIGMLRALATDVIGYNTLQDAEKKTLSQQSGTTPSNSTATSADVSPSYEG